ncbi:MAG: sigma-54 dependent transcriptional regulator [Caldimonas sp.]
MKICSCAVVSFDAPGEAAECIAAALREDARIAVLAPSTGTSAAASDCAGAVFVTDARAFGRALNFIECWRKEFPGAALIVAGIDLDAPQLAALLACGVHDFVSVPFAPQELLTRLRRALGLTACEPAMREKPTDPRLRHFIGSHPSFTAQVAKLPTLASCDAGVLILGETGTGKEVCAQAIHYLSARTSRPWVAVNCGAMPTELVENELFGHVKGAYTTAHAGRSGLVREAEGGTLFLDDVDCLPLSAQVKLLRFVQEREYRAVGSNSVQRADVRLIAASNHRLPQMVARGEFRQDLYFRLNVLTLELPPLRERRSDIALLAQHFMRRFSERHGRRIAAFSPRALERLIAHDWPGNVRELQHAIERAVLLARGPTLGVSDVEIDGAGPAESADATFRAAKDRVVRQFERGYIERLLASCGGNVTHAALQAGKNRRAFFELMRKHDIAAAPFRDSGAAPAVQPWRSR